MATDQRPVYVQYLDPADNVTKRSGPYHGDRAASVAFVMLQYQGMQNLAMYRQVQGPHHRYW